MIFRIFTWTNPRSLRSAVRSCMQLKTFSRARRTPSSASSRTCNLGLAHALLMVHLLAVGPIHAKVHRCLVGLSAVAAGDLWQREAMCAD